MFFRILGITGRQLETTLAPIELFNYSMPYPTITNCSEVYINQISPIYSEQFLYEQDSFATMLPNFSLVSNPGRGASSENNQKYPNSIGPSNSVNTFGLLRSSPSASFSQNTEYHAETGPLAQPSIQMKISVDKLDLFTNSVSDCDHNNKVNLSQHDIFQNTYEDFGQISCIPRPSPNISEERSFTDINFEESGALPDLLPTDLSLSSEDLPDDGDESSMEIIFEKNIKSSGSWEKNENRKLTFSETIKNCVSLNINNENMGLNNIIRYSSTSLLGSSHVQVNEMTEIIVN